MKDTRFVPSYEAHIDGLRAIAILLVVFFHAFPKLLPGGYIGVDVFFVISGFLITRIALSEYYRGVFTLVGFWRRRIRRIVPPLILMLLFVAIAGWWILLEDEFVQLGKHIFAGAFFFSNFVYAREFGYFDVAAEFKPLLHLWSLGIEEQFYIIWPVVIVLSGRRHLLRSVLILTVFSWILSVYWVSKNTTHAFFLPDSRMWELLVGAIVAFYEVNNKINIPKKTREALGVVGLLVIGFAVIYFDKNTHMPGYWALLPTFGAVCLILCKGGVLARSFLENPGMIWVGKLSYPLYLWHWPFLVFLNIMKISSVTTIGMALIATVLVSYLTEKFLQRVVLNHKLLVSGAVTATFFVGVVGLLIRQKGVAPYSSRFDLTLVSKSFNDWGFPGKDVKSFEFNGRTFSFLGRSVDSSSVLFLGDSNLEHYGPTVERLLKEKQNVSSVVFATGGGCAPLRFFARTDQPDGGWCGGLVKSAEKLIVDKKIKSIVVGAYWYGYFTEPQHYLAVDGKRIFLDYSENGWNLWLDVLKTQLKDYKRLGLKVYLVGNIPVAEALNPHNIINRNIFSGIFTVKIDPIKRDALESEVFFLNGKLEELARQVGVTYLSPLDEICDSGLCPVWSDKGPLYKDNAHIRPHVAQQLHFMDMVFEK